MCSEKLPLPPKPIIQLSTQSKILIAGQAPGIVAHNKGRPFDDKSGERLRCWLNIDEASFYDANKVAIVPMGFCYPGKGKSGDLPPIPLCAKSWRKQVLNSLKDLKLTILVGKYAVDWHLTQLAMNASLAIDKSQYKNTTEVISDWETLLKLNHIALPHPSPRNNRWLKKNPWFEQTVIPVLQQRINDIQSEDG